MRGRRIQHKMDGLLALLLFTIFTACMLAVLLTGARAYRRLTQRDQAAYDSRTCVQYIAARVRQSDMQDGVSVAGFDGTQALVLQDSSGYLTRVYWHDGYLMELYAAADAELSVEDGTKLLAAQAVTFTLEDGLLTTCITSAGEENTLRLSLRSQKGAAS